jgi:hypothetical protein
MDGAEGRTAGSGLAWDSALGVSDFAAITSVGFEPVGQVFGAAVYYLREIPRSPDSPAGARPPRQLSP